MRQNDTRQNEPKRPIRNLVVVLGDQLDHESAAFDGIDPSSDIVWMAEVAGESTYVWSHKARIIMFLAAMRHFHADLARKHLRVDYRMLSASGPATLGESLALSLAERKPERVVLVEPGEYRVESELVAACQASGVPFEVRPDRHFYCSRQEFKSYAEGRNQLRLEYFYRDLRRRHDVLMDDGQPSGGKWNFDASNRQSFAKAGPSSVPVPHAFPPDAITQQVIDEVNRHFPDHPGDLSRFQFPVTAEEAALALDDFIALRLPTFGAYQDAMWTGEPFLFHSRLSAAMNLKLLPARRVVQAAEQAYRKGTAPLEAVEGFIRQILGWREYVRGIYWTFMPEYATRNALDAHEPLPPFYWTAQTEMNCLRDALSQTLVYGYAHHIQRLMVTGLYALLLGVEPVAIHQWYLAVYIDAVEWVELPNVMGMSQFADGGLMASKPYAATGKYIRSMSNYCDGCRFRPDEATGPDACPYTTLYWDFLDRHRELLAKNQRMSLQVRNLDRLSAERLVAIRERATEIRSHGGAPAASASAFGGINSIPASAPPSDTPTKKRKRTV